MAPGGEIEMAIPRLCWCAGFIISISLGPHCAWPGTGEPDKFVQLAIPLNRDGAYSLRAFCRVCNEKLKSGYPLERIEDRDILVTSQNKRILELARLVGIDVRLEPTRLVLRLPNPDCEAGRGEQRRNLERMLGVPSGTWPADLGLSLPKGFDADAPSAGAYAIAVRPDRVKADNSFCWAEE